MGLSPPYFTTEKGLAQILLCGQNKGDYKIKGGGGGQNFKFTPQDSEMWLQSKSREEGGPREF